jgi:hypothetical protein
VKGIGILLRFCVYFVECLRDFKEIVWQDKRNAHRMAVVAPSGQWEDRTGNRSLFPVILPIFLLASGITDAAQKKPERFEIGGHYVLLQQRAFDVNDSGFGAWFAFKPTAEIGVEAEFNFFPGDLGRAVALSRHRGQALFGIKAGRRFGDLGVFGKVRPGLVIFGKAPRGVACVTILVYPPPLECLVSLGSTNLALDFGGVLEFYPGPHAMIRLDLGDTLIRFDGPAYTRFGRFDDDFNVHNLQVNIGFGFRF